MRPPVACALESLFRNAGASETRIEWARAVMARQFRHELEEIVERGARETVKLPGYQHLQLELLRPNTRRGMLAILTTLEGGDWLALGDVFAEVAYGRASQGVDPTAIFALIDLTEDQIGELASHCLSGAEDLTLAAIIARRICDAGRKVIIDAFQRAHREARSAAQRLAAQFSAPVLPALPGVLVLPLVGELATARAQQVVDALLAAISRHTAHTAILDLTGLTATDATLAGHLQRIAACVRLLGARLVLAGVGPTLAAKLAGDTHTLHTITVHATLADALVVAARASPAR